MPRRILVGFSPHGEKERSYPPWIFAAFAPEDPQSSLALNQADRTAQSSDCWVFCPGMKLAPRLPSPCCALQSGIRMLQSLAIYGARASDALHPALRSHIPALTHHYWGGATATLRPEHGPKWGLPPTITRAGLLLCSLPPGAQPTVSMSHPWDHTAVDL